ncbi:MAG TPA: VOC family protein [Rhizomicrobium sp.]|jgi:catechol 2,3-dioxygenase-like lactoylglutathione lyase family enzyme|nr:VOC family protein [Rhizomicrobium sp.]
MIGYVTIGAKDSEASGKFYDAVLGACGCDRKFADGGWIGYGAKGRDEHDVFVCPPFNKEAASFGNGMMIAFKAPSREAVDAAYRLGLAQGGSDEGAPGFRPPEKQSWYGAYLRDPTGNKIAVFFTP